MIRITPISTLCCALLFAASTHAQNAAEALQPGARYVALGSSFAAGPGVPEPTGSCGRSDSNYANLVASALELSLTDVSCNGATTDNIRHTPQDGAAPQIDAVTDQTMLVTVTIGGNDINYTSSTFACAGTPANDQCTANLDQEAIADAVDQLPGKLAATIDAIRDNAPRLLSYWSPTRTCFRWMQSIARSWNSARKTRAIWQRSGKRLKTFS